MNQPNRPKPPRSREVKQYPSISYRKRKPSSTVGALIYALLFVLVILICLFVIVQNRQEANTEEETRYIAFDSTIASLDKPQPSETAPPGPPSTIIRIPCEDVSIANTEIVRGDLILINYSHPYVFPDSQPQTLLYGNKSPVYQLSRADISLNTELFPIFDGMLADFAKASGCKEVLVTSGYRTFQFQKQLLDDRIKTQGEEKARLYVAEPGYSEHHAGLAVDMVIFAGGQQYYFPDYEDAAWLIENAPRYGFILRYTEANQEITHCAPEPWHYRYVGTPHAEIITTQNLSFEEYHTYLQTYQWDGMRLYRASDGTLSEIDGYTLPDNGHMIYYVPAEAGSSTTIPVPPESSYTISGDNINGFIVTVRLG